MTHAGAVPLARVTAQPLRPAAMRWLGVGALVVSGFELSRLAGHTMIGAALHQRWPFAPFRWWDVVVVSFVAMSLAWPIGAVGLLRSPDRQHRAVKFAAFLSIALAVYALVHYPVFNGGGEPWYIVAYETLVSVQDVLQWLVIGVTGLLLLSGRADGGRPSPASVVRWVGVVAIVIGTQWLVTYVPSVGRSLFFHVRHLSRLGLSEVGELLMAVGSIGWLVIGAGVVRHRPGMSSTLLVASAVWAAGALSYLAIRCAHVFQIHEPWYVLVTEALDSVRWFLAGLVFAAASVVALRHEAVQAALPRRQAARGFSPVLADV